MTLVCPAAAKISPPNVAERLPFRGRKAAPQSCQIDLITLEHRIILVAPAFGLHRAMGWQSDPPRKTAQLQPTNKDPGNIKLPPLQPMPRRGGKCVVIVVPSFAKTDDAEDRIVP